MKVSHSLKRLLIQTIAALAQNPLLQNIWLGSIYKGPAKVICSPGLNCWSCPAAAMACPIGAMQKLAATPGRTVSFYAIGFVILLGSLFGRLICGFICPFGFLQDLLHRIPLPKVKFPARIDKPLRYLKYVILALLVLILPFAIVDDFGLGTTWFCEILCPAGTIEAGIPLLIADPALRALTGALFDWKVIVAAIIVIASTMIRRPFCKYLCPLGAFYGLLNRTSVIKPRVNHDACVNCGRCVKVCPMGVDVTRQIGTSPECIRCGDCKGACPVNAITWTVVGTPLPRNHKDAGIK